jgi:RNA polymerase sigma-70 factor (ECF subfamily)
MGGGALAMQTMEMVPAELAGALPRVSDVDAATLARLRRREPEAFERLVIDYQDRVYDFCLRMLGDVEEATDVAQDVFVALHQHLPGFREDSKLSTWIYRISKNHCLNRLKYLGRRGRGRRGVVEDADEALLERTADSAPAPDEALIARAERESVHAAIAQLEDDQRMLVGLRDIEGLSYEEIVEITELPLGTVKSRLHRARERLAKALGGEP